MVAGGGFYVVVICLKFRGHKKQIVGSHAGMEFEADPVPIRLNNRVLFVLFFFYVFL